MNSTDDGSLEIKCVTQYEGPQAATTKPSYMITKCPEEYEGSETAQLCGTPVETFTSKPG